MANRSARRRARSRPATLTGALVAAAVLVMPTPAHAVGERTCGPVTLGPPLDPPPAMVDDEPGTVGGPAHASPTLDMDGDAVADVVAQPDPTRLTVTRGDGVLTVEDVPPDPPYAGYPAQHGSRLVGDDLDGDGRDELVWTRWFVTGFQRPLTYETRIVRGTTAAGTVSMPDVALAVDGDLSADIDDDGLDDLRLDLQLANVAMPPRWVRRWLCSRSASSAM